jgi:chromosome transmission fidelity protein 4
VTQMFFSPTQNLIAWMDDKGTLTRWPSPIPASSAHPVKPANNSATTQVKRKLSPNLFDNLDADNGLGDNVDADIDMDEMGNEDWILDDLGGGMDDEPEAERWDDKDGIVKEMGLSITCFHLSVCH